MSGKYLFIGVGLLVALAGVPAAIVKELGEDGKFLIENNTRLDLPDDI